MIYWFAHGLWMVISKVFFPIRVYGREHLPQKKGFILASNHLSNLDPMVLGLASGRRLSYVAKESLFKNKFFAFVLHQVGAFPIKRDAADIGAIKEAIRRLKSGSSVVIFPQGTRKAKAEEEKIQSGVGLLAAKSQASIIPAFIQGSEHILAAGRRFIKPGRIRVFFGPAVFYNPSDSYQDLAIRTMRCINELASGAPVKRF